MYDKAEEVKILIGIYSRAHWCYKCRLRKYTLGEHFCIAFWGSLETDDRGEVLRHPDCLDAEKEWVKFLKTAIATDERLMDEMRMHDVCKTELRRREAENAGN